MARTDIYLKIVVEHELDEDPKKLAEELCRQAAKVWGVRNAEVSNLVGEPLAET